MTNSYIWLVMATIAQIKRYCQSKKCDACFVDLINLVLHQPDDESSLECLKNGIKISRDTLEGRI